MYKLFSPRKILPVLLVSLCFSACIDDNYDLSNLDTDRLVAGDLWSLPLGKGVLSASELLEVDNVDEIDLDANGDYVARYSDVIDVVPENIPSIKDYAFRFPFVGITVPDMTGYPGGYRATIPAVSQAFQVRSSDEVIELRRAEFNTGPQKSLLTVVMTFNGTIIPGGTVILGIDLPDGFVVDENHVPSGVTVNGTAVTWSFNLFNTGSYKLALPISRLDMTGNKTVSVSGTIDIPGSSPGNIDTEVLFEVGLENMDYTVIYGEFEIDFVSSPESAYIGGLYDIFEGEETMLSFRDPHIIINSESNVGMAVNAELEIYADTDPNGDQGMYVDGIVIPAARNFGDVSHASFWIGEERPSSGDYIFRYAPGLGGVIKDSREFVFLTGSGETGESDGEMFYPENAVSMLNYIVGIPLAPAPDFFAVSEQVVEDTFDDDVIDYLFNGGTVEIYGTATNSIPLKFMLYLTVTDWEGNSVGISLPPQPIAGPVSDSEPSVSKLSFLFDEAAVAKMGNAKNLLLSFEASGTEDASTLNVAHEVVLNLKMRKSGGIVISSDDDDEE